MSYRRSAGYNLARHWLARNTPVEQIHAELLVHPGEGSGVSRHEMLHRHAPCGTRMRADWFEYIRVNDSLAASIAGDQLCG